MSDEHEKETVIVEEPTPRVERETTIIDTGDRGGGGGGALIAVVLLLAVVVLLFLYFGGYLGGAGDETSLNVNVETPAINLPDVNVEPAPAPAPEPAPPGNSG